MRSRPPDSGIYMCTGCCQMFSGPGAAESCRLHVRRCARLHLAFGLALIVLVGVLLLRFWGVR